MNTERRPEPSPRDRARSLGVAIVLLAALTPPATARAAETIELSIEGVTGEARRNVEAALRLNRRRSDPRLTGEAIRELHGTAEEEIRRALEPFGYYRPAIESELLPPGPEAAAWRARYAVDPGKPVPIAAIDVDLLGAGAEDAELASVVKSLPLVAGQPFVHLDYERAKQELLTAIRKRGYRDADYEQHRVEVDVAAYAATIRLAVETGPLYVIGPIAFEQSRFAERYLERYLVLEPGEAYALDEITRQRRLLSRSGHFQEVLIQPGEASADSPPAVPLTVSLLPFKANRYRGELGWGTDTGIGVQGDWNRRYVGRHGHQFTLGGSGVQDQERIAADFRYSIPVKPLSGERLELTARYQSRTLTFEDVDLDEGGETEVENILLSAFWYFPVASPGDFQLRTRAGLSFVGDSYDIFAVLFGNLPASDQEAIIGFIGQEAFDTLSPSFETVVPSVRLTARRSDDRLFIRNGDYFDLELLGASQSLGSNIDFWQLRFNHWTIRPVSQRSRLLLRTAAGYSDAETRNLVDLAGIDFNRMPEYYEFRAGGARSIRGYRFEELVPASAITGGKHQLIASVEYEHEIIPDWSVAAFVDVGNAFNDFDRIDEKYGTGLGARWRSPVGLARIDLAFPLDDGEESFQIYITVGPEF